MLTLPLKWNDSALRAVADTSHDDYISNLIASAVTINKGFNGVSELDWERTGTPVAGMLNRNVTKPRAEYVVLTITRLLRERCGINVEGVRLGWEGGNTLEIEIKYRGGGSAVVKL